METGTKLRLNKTLIIVLGIYQIAGGIFGLSAVFGQSLLYILGNLLSFAIIIGLFIYSLICGIYLITYQQPGLGIKLSFINQYLQLLQFEILGNGIYYVAGCYLSLGFSDTPQLHLVSEHSIFRSSCFISFLVDSNEITLSLNIAAIIILFCLNYLNKQYFPTALDLYTHQSPPDLH